MACNLEPTEQSIMTLSFKTLSINLTLKCMINPERKPYHKTVFTFISNTIYLHNPYLYLQFAGFGLGIYLKLFLRILRGFLEPIATNSALQTPSEQPTLSFEECKVRWLSINYRQGPSLRSKGSLSPKFRTVSAGTEV